MASEGAEIYCPDCGKRWVLNEDGSLSAKEGVTEFSSIPEWFEWERREVSLEIDRGEYSFSDDVDVFSMPACNKFPCLGEAKFIHDPTDGFKIIGNYNGAEYVIHRTPLQTNSLHVEYDWFRIRKDDCVDISTENDSFYCYFKHSKNVVTKLAFATELIYEKSLEAKRREKMREKQSV